MKLSTYSGPNTGKARGFRAALFLLFSLAFVVSAKADNIAVASVGTATDPGQFNSNGDTIAIAPNTAWAPALSGTSWVSFGLTGDTQNPGFFVVPNGTIVSFYDVFNVTGIATGGTITVMADDSASVLLNGVTLMGEASPIGNTYNTCSDFGIGCIRPTTFDLPVSVLQTGSNTLEFQVAQRAGSSFGLDYSGSVTDPIATPEPASGILLGFGLLIVALVGLGRRYAMLSLGR